jgi:hypothetical protein
MRTLHAETRILSCFIFLHDSRLTNNSMYITKLFGPHSCCALDYDRLEIEYNTKGIGTALTWLLRSSSCQYYSSDHWSILRCRHLVITGARHEGGLSKSEDGDTVDTEVARVNVFEELGLKLGLDITYTTLATDLVGQGVGDGVGDGLGVGSATVGPRNDESENVIYKDILSNDTVIDPDAHLKERSLCEGCRISDLAVISRCRPLRGRRGRRLRPRYRQKCGRR